jgi:fermentation-respiration switch protein FrsA (DUF1100 family)
MVISPKIKAGVIWAGVVASYPDLLTRWRRNRDLTPTPGASGSRSWRWTWIEEYGTPEENLEFWSAISANSYLADLNGPIQLHHGTADESVPLEFSQLLNDQMQQAGKTVELYTYEGITTTCQILQPGQGTRTIEFFNTYLKGKVETQPLTDIQNKIKRPVCHPPYPAYPSGAAGKDAVALAARPIGKKELGRLRPAPPALEL